MPRQIGGPLKRWEKTEAKKKLNALNKKRARLSYDDINYVINALLWAYNGDLTYGDLLKIRELSEKYK